MRQKKVYCHHCQAELLVSQRAFSVNCSHCHRRVSVEDFYISSYHNTGQIETCGSLLVGPAGDLRACLMVQDLQVQGQLHGNVFARGKVSLARSGRLFGNITASRLEVACGAVVKGFCRIEPNPMETSEEIL